MNTSADRSYELGLPFGIRSAEDVASGRLVDANVMVGPHSTRVLYVAAGSDTRPLPFAPRFLSATRSAGDVALDWDPVSGASSYRVERTASSGGARTALATSVAESAFADQTGSENQSYCYVVTAENAYGVGAPSPELCVEAQ